MDDSQKKFSSEFIIKVRRDPEKINDFIEEGPRFSTQKNHHVGLEKQMQRSSLRNSFRALTTEKGKKQNTEIKDPIFEVKPKSINKV